MRVVTSVDDQRQLTICLGRQSENTVTEVGFDISAWIAEYGSGTASILIQRPTDSAAAPVLTSMDGNIAYHSLTNGDLQYTGNGKIEIAFTVGTKLKKGKVYTTKILDALSSTESAPDPWQSWVDEVLEAADTAEESAESAEDSADSASASATSASNSASSASTSASNAASSASQAATAVSHYPYIDETTGDWFVWDADDGEWVDTGIHAKGEKGDKGDKGDVNVATFTLDPLTGILYATWSAS